MTDTVTCPGCGGVFDEDALGEGAGGEKLGVCPACSHHVYGDQQPRHEQRPPLRLVPPEEADD